ncbi:hypothetical protein LY78DRAFT_664461 [Colletotrichum sublineola]|nr:hypothetical protein LY78DRAFT_664461 [Colletotrichum sublineola]
MKLFYIISLALTIAQVQALRCRCNDSRGTCAQWLEDTRATCQVFNGKMTRQNWCETSASKEQFLHNCHHKTGTCA